MRITSILVATLTLVVAAATIPRSEATEPQQADLACVIMQGDHASAATRTSPLDSVSFEVAGGQVKVCYGRPSVRGREIFGAELVPYGQVWRTGANEPTMIHTSVPLQIGDIRVDPGTYSLYTVPGESEWQIIVNRSTEQWGIESQYTEEVQAQELGRVTVPAEQIGEPVETFTIQAVPKDGGSVDLVLEWERTRVAVPIKPAG